MCALDPDAKTFDDPDKIMKIVDSSLIGEAMYKSSVMVILSRRVAPIVLCVWQNALEAIKNPKDKEKVDAPVLKQIDIDSIVQSSMDQVLKLPAGSSLEATRTISLTFMTVELGGIEVAGVCDECEIRVMAMVKECGIAHKQIDAMSFETLLGCKKDPDYHSIPVQEAVLVKAI